MKTIKFIIFIIVITVITVIFSVNVSAQSVLPLAVAPARQELEVKPGEKTGVVIRFYNTGDVPVSGVLKAADFLVRTKDGSPVIIDNPQQASPKYSASSWFKLHYDRITIAANDKVTVQADIQTPSEARPGGRYVAIFFEPAGSFPRQIGTSPEAGAAVSSRIAGLVYIRVAGEVFEKALISRFFAPSFFEYGPIKVETEILNRGDYHLRPRGVLTMTNLFGAAVDQVPLKEENIFPDASREYKNELGQKWMLGKYKLSLAAGYGEKGQALTAAAYVWVFPWRVALAVILTIIILALIIGNLYKNIIIKETNLEEELKKEQEEIEKLKQMLRKKE